VYQISNNVVSFEHLALAQVCKIYPAGVPAPGSEFHLIGLSGPEKVVLFNAMVKFAQDNGVAGEIPTTVKRFADNISAMRRINVLRAQIESHLATIPEVVPPVVIEDKPTKPAKVVAPKKAKAKAKVEGEIVETKGLSNLPVEPKGLLVKKDGTTVVVGKKTFEDHMVITVNTDKPGHVDAAKRWHLYQTGMTVGAFIEAAKAWLRTQPEFADRRDGGPTGLNWKVRDWLAADAKRSTRISIA
jgi:hypothetical protein